MSTPRIRTIARLKGIREATLRAWERRYGFPRPHRGEGNNYRACSVVVGGPAARDHLRTLFSGGAQYAESADELMALWQQARVASNRI